MPTPSRRADPRVVLVGRESSRTIQWLRKPALALGASMLVVVASPAARGQCELNETAHVLASDGTYDDSFGCSVALFGDTAVVGAMWHDTPSDPNYPGAAYVFARTDGAWMQQAQLLAVDGDNVDLFGRSVAISGDTIVVGAFWDDTSNGINTGSAYVFVRSDGLWTQQAHLVAADGARGDEFGNSVAISGDTVLVGAPGFDSENGLSVGAAYVFVRSGAAWTQQAQLLATDGATSDRFGVAVALDGDTAIVGADSDDTPAGVNAGSAYVFVRSGVHWSQQAQLKAPDGAANDNLGCSVALSGDSAVVGALGVDTPARGADAGAAHVFVRDAGVWLPQGRLSASDGAADDRFGRSVAIAGDTVIVGASDDDTPGGSSAGSAYAFTREDGIWEQRARLFASDGAGSDFFGWSVTISESTVVVGAIGDNTPFLETGSVYVFSLGCIACVGDLDGDGSVGLADLSALLTHFGVASGMTYADGDIDGDGGVSMKDLSALLENYGAECS